MYVSLPIRDRKRRNRIEMLRGNIEWPSWISLFGIFRSNWHNVAAMSPEYIGAVDAAHLAGLAYLAGSATKYNGQLAGIYSNG